MYFCSKSLGMTSKMKMKIKAGIFAGIFMVLFMSAIDYFSDENFSWVKAIVQFVLFALLFGATAKEKPVEDSKFK
jgi:hypothetical protein